MAETNRGVRLFTDPGENLREKSGEFRVMEQMGAGMISQGLTINA